MLKQINTEDLKPGKKYLIEMEFKKEEGELYPLNFTDADNANYCFSKAQPIYTLDDQPQKPDPELEMLVNVAIALMINDLHFTENEIEEELGHKLSEDKKERAKQWASAYKKLIARDAADLIAACKKIKEGER